ncbi:MAG TPA: MmgE/PrpD family protein [Devosia sp.]|nr:MmgE/PrpD family protein [Devosia sp.]
MALAAFVADIVDIPTSVRVILQDAMIDAIGCGLFGLTTEPCRIVHLYALDQAGPPETTLWASGSKRISAANAALAMGTAIHGFDFDDHSRAKIHPGAVVIAAALALGEREGADGRTFLRAVAAGYEVMNRISLAVNPNASRMRGWHLTGTTGTFGAAAAASVILGLDASTTASAFGLAGTQSAGLWAFNADGAMSKRLHPGAAARSGIAAAELAQRGFEGPRYVLEAADGGFLAATSDDVRLGEIARGLGTEWRTEGTCFKPYSCCGSNHASIDAALSLKRDYGFDVSDINKIVVGISRVVERQTGFPYVQGNALNAQMSIRHNVAAALLDGQVLIEQFTSKRLADPALNTLIAQVEVEVDPEMDAIYPAKYAGITTINLRDGRQLRRRVDYSKGMPENRMSIAEIESKYLSLAGTAVGDGTARQILQAVSGIFDAPNLSELSAQLGAVRITP